jgi:hypothetical protein
VYARGAEETLCMPPKIASKQRATDLKPGISWFVAELFSETAK